MCGGGKPKPRDDWWRTDEPPELPEDPEVLRERERKAKKPSPHEVMGMLQGGGLRRVDMVANEVEDVYVRALCRELQKHPVERVYLGANPFGVGGWEAVIGLIRCHPTITRWSLAKTHIPRCLRTSLAEAVAESCSLESLDLACCTGLRGRGAALLHSAVSQNTRITCLYLRGSDAPEGQALTVQSLASSRREDEEAAGVG